MLLCLLGLHSTTLSVVCMCRRSDVAWAITTAVDAQPLVAFAQKDKVLAALVQPSNASSGSQQPLTAESPSQLLLSHTASSPLLLHPQ